MKRLARLANVLITVVGCVGFDQITKIAAQNLLMGHLPIPMVGGHFNLYYAENPGATLSIGRHLSQDLRFAIFVVGVGSFLVAATIFVLKKPLDRITVFAISLVIGGGLSNVIDRLIHNGLVVDFMLIKALGSETGIFNVADVAITFGVLLLALLSLRHRDKVST